MKYAFLALPFLAFVSIAMAKTQKDPALDKRFQVVDESTELLNPDTFCTILSHGRKTEDVYVLLHGLTNAPPQFVTFGERLYGTGANVIIPRLPWHGWADRMNTEHRRMTGSELTEQADRVIDYAHTLGKRVTVVGLSASGVTAAWVAQNRPDVDTAVLLAPFFGIGFVPDVLTVPSGLLLGGLPNSFMWWNPMQKENLVGSPYAYPRFSTHALSQIIKLGIKVFRQASRNAPAVSRIIVVTNPDDVAVNNTRTSDLVRMWKRRAPESVIHYMMPDAWNLPHDFIDPWVPDQKMDQAYPLLIRWFLERDKPAKPSKSKQDK